MTIDAVPARSKILVTIVAALGLAACGLSPIGEARATSEPASSAKEVPGDVLLLIDLSPSMRSTSDVLFADIVGRVLRALPPLSRFSIRLMQSSNTDAEPLLSDAIPNPVRTAERISVQQQHRAWQAEIEADIRAYRGRKTLPPGLSCYLKSLEFADGYFEARASGRTLVVWVGDLIEDCREPGTSTYSRLRIDQWQPGSAAARVKQLRSVPQLTTTGVLAIIVPRGEENSRQVDGDTVRAYWSEVLPLFGVTNDRFSIGTPDMVRIELVNR